METSARFSFPVTPRDHPDTDVSAPTEAIVYPNTDIPVFIPSFNNPTHLRKMIAQLMRIGFRSLTIIDNGSKFPPLVDYLDSIAQTHEVIRKPTNEGPRHIVRDPVFYEQLPQYFCLTDPDLEFNPELPADFLAHLIEIISRHHIGKAGFALDISAPERMRDERFQIAGESYRIWEWEAQFWKTPLPADETPDLAYRALIDTTFALYNKAFLQIDHPYEAIRVAGRYTARHLPWYRDEQLPPDEAAFYRATSQHSFYLGQPPAD